MAKRLLSGSVALLTVAVTFLSSSLSVLAAAPTVTTGGASSITETGATLNGTVEYTDGLEVTEVGFEYGLDTGYGSSESQIVSITNPEFVDVESFANNAEGMGQLISVDSSNGYTVITYQGEFSYFVNTYDENRNPVGSFDIEVATGYGATPGGILAHNGAIYYPISAYVFVLDYSGALLDTIFLDENGAKSIDIDSAGNLYVARNDEVNKFDSDGDLLQTFPFTIYDSMSNIVNDVAVDALGNVYLFGYEGYEVYASNGTLLSSQLPTLPGFLFGGDVDSNGLVYLNTPYVNVHVYTIDGDHITTIVHSVNDTNEDVSLYGDDVYVTYGFIGLTDDVVAVFQNQGSEENFDLSISGLSCGTEYFFRSYAVNVDGTSYGSDESFVTSDCPTIPETDTDGDGVNDSIEDAGPNGGDSNGDGTMDSEQAHVETSVNAVTGEYMTVEVTGACTDILDRSGVSETSLDVASTTYDFPYGLVDLTLECATTPGGSSTVKIYYSQQYNTSTWRYVKFNPNTDVYTDITSSVTFGTATVGSTTVTTVSYTLTDGGFGDDDGVANSRIYDPAGPAVLAAIAPTGDSFVNVQLALFGLLSALLGGVYLSRKSFFN